jgi:dTDP-4-amino-4,6-dideoxygalactose transaminase
MFPVLLRNGDERSAIRARMWDKFVDTSMIYSQAIEECRRYGYRGGCPVAESVSERLITLPNHAALTGRDIDVVAEVFLASLQAARRTRASYFGRTPETAGGVLNYASDS